MMNTVRVEEAIGMVLAHDLTKIIPGEFKGAAFKKGHIIRPQDIEVLKNMGKNHINVFEPREGYIHENEAAARIAHALAGNSGLSFCGPSEGKVEIRSKVRGVVKIRVDALERINEVEELVVAAIHTNSVADAGQNLAATRIIPLEINEEKIRYVEEIGREYSNRIIELHELKPMKVGLVITGTEVFAGRIKDGFAPVMKEKITHYGCCLVDARYCPDNLGVIEGCIEDLITKGADIILACGGMSVDADDVTPLAIRNVSEQVVSYGMPVIPGNMLMLAYKGSTAILGIPAAAIFLKTTSLDLLLPRLLIGERLERRDLTAYGHGGLCLGCRSCLYPICPYGR